MVLNNNKGIAFSYNLCVISYFDKEVDKEPAQFTYNDNVRLQKWMMTGKNNLHAVVVTKGNVELQVEAVH